MLRKAFDAFDRERSGSIPTDMVADILRLMGQPFNKKILDELIEEVDADSKYNIVTSLVLRTKNERTFTTLLAKDNTSIALLKSTIKTP